MRMWPDVKPDDQRADGEVADDQKTDDKGADDKVTDDEMVDNNAAVEVVNDEVAGDKTNDHAMDVDPVDIPDIGGHVYAKEICPHIMSSVDLPQNVDVLPDLAASTECSIAKCDATESWVCLKCHQVFCGRYGQKHMIQHKDNNPDHQIAMGCGDLSFWCYQLSAGESMTR